MIDRGGLIKYYSQFIDEEGLFIKTLDLIISADQKYTAEVTPFLTPDLRLLFTRIIKSQTELEMTTFSVFEASERAKLAFWPPYTEPVLMENHVALLEVTFNQKFNELSHRDVLGALMALGIKRSSIGDIVAFEGGFQIAVDVSLKDYFLQNIEKIGRAGVNVRTCPFEDKKEPVIDKKMCSGTVKSIRLDSIVALAFSLSRTEAQQLVESERVKVNYVITDKCGHEPVAGDLISVRGHGRLVLEEILGTTKKDRIRITLSVFSK